ncbi:hypothetical protein K457DRAFT_121749 [Linnemannia elongata AG-77]|uniref:USP8 dimerisation domain-containing protein n=1 Tax=Linnemannia elongata AG-77 TaxID=1314771 RepID=A0A197KBP7_9FUNG|nr:hypothetical protein K457DRAFT_121749 [Linnemannia elongata AG-77]
MKRIIRSFSRPNSVVEPPQSIDSRARRSLGNFLSKTRSAPAPEDFVLQFPQRTIEQLKQQSTPLPPPSIIPVHSKQSVPQQQQTNQKRQRRIHHHQPLQQQDTMEFIESNNVSNISMPPRARLLELKTNAEFAAEDFNHTIKTWVNMASLLVKQGNVAESKGDDENAYISYVRACLIITKIIPVQPHYRSMMNDIVCIDLRQKILLIITRMGRLERRLLKRFEDENRQVATAARITQVSAVAQLNSLTSSKTTVVTTTMNNRPTSTVFKVERNMNKLSVEYYSPEEPVVDQEEDYIDDESDDESVDGRENINIGVYSNDDSNDEVDIDNDDEIIATVEIHDNYLTNDGADLMLELSPESYVNHHHRRVMTGPRSEPSSQQPPPYQQLHYDDQNHTPEKPINLNGTLKKKSSNEDDRSLLSPECQPNYTAMPSALFPRQREGFHVRRCSSTDTIRSSVHFPANSLSIATALPLATTPRANLATPPIPVRSDKRSSMMASMTFDRNNINNIGNSNVNYARDRSNQGAAAVPDYRGTAAAGSGPTTTTTAVRGGYDRDVLHSRFSNRRTMSFEGNGNFYPSLGGVSSSAFDVQQQPAHTGGASALWRHNSTSVGRVTPGNSHSRNGSSLGHRKRASFDLHQHQQQKQHQLQYHGNGITAAYLNADLPPTPRSSLEKLSEHFSAGSSTTSMGGSSKNGFSPSPSTSPSTASSTPFASPMMKTGAQMPQSFGVIQQQQRGQGPAHGHGHVHTPSLTSSITSGLTLVTTDSINSSVTYTPTTAMSVGSPQLSNSTSMSSSSSPTTTSFSSWTTSGKKAGLLRKIRSKPKMQDMFDMVQVPISPSPAPAPAQLPLPLHRQQQQQYQQQQQLHQQQQQHQVYPTLAMRT